MLTVLITGSMGSGKSSLADFLELKSYPVFRADVQAKSFLNPQSPYYQRLKELFGEKCLLGQSKEFDKKKLAGEIFNFPEKRKKMEAIIHPEVQKTFKQFVNEQRKIPKSTLVFYEAPIISYDIFDLVNQRILLVCPKKIKMKRLIKKGWTKKEILVRWATQISESKIKDRMDFIIDNSGDFQHLYSQVDKILTELLKKRNNQITSI